MISHESGPWRRTGFRGNKYNITVTMDAEESSQYPNDLEYPLDDPEREGLRRLMATTAHDRIVHVDDDSYEAAVGDGLVLLATSGRSSAVRTRRWSRSSRSS